MIKPVVSWVVVADASRARVLVNDGPNHGLTVEREFEQEGYSKHATELPDQVREQKRRFAREIARALDDARKQNAFERLYLVAPPQVLGELRSELTPELSKMVAGELNKDLTKIPLRDLPGHLGPLLPV